MWLSVVEKSWSTKATQVILTGSEEAEEENGGFRRTISQQERGLKSVCGRSLIRTTQRTATPPERGHQPVHRRQSPCILGSRLYGLHGRKNRVQGTVSGNFAGFFGRERTFACFVS